MTADTGSRRRRGASRVLRVLVVLAIALMSSVSTAAAQAVYGSISGTVSDATGGVLPGATVVVTSVERKTVDTVIANESGFFVKDRLVARRLRGEGRPPGLQVGGRPEGRRRRRYAGAGQLQARGRLLVRGNHRHRRRAAAQDRPRRRGDALRFQGADGAAGARSELHEVHPADAGRTATRLAARRIREPAGLDADPGQRPELQRHRLSARRHRESRSDSGHHRRQPDAGVDWRVQGHVAELRRRVRPGDGWRRVGADQVGHQRPPRQCASSSSRTRPCRRATLSHRPGWIR